MTLNEFGQRIKGLIPGYGDIADNELGKKVFIKFPQYWDLIDNIQEELRKPIISKVSFQEIPTETFSSGQTPYPIGQPKNVFPSMVKTFQDVTGGTENERIFAKQARGERLTSQEMSQLGLGAAAGMIGGLKDVTKKAVTKVAPSVFKGFKDLSTKILERLKGKTITSKQEILDFTNMPELRQSERDVIRGIIDTYKEAKIPVQEFANKVKSELLPLKISSEGITKYGRISGRYESISLPEELRGNVANYSEHIWESPIKTSAGGTHFSDKNIPNYFGHTRIEDMAPEWKVGNTTYQSEQTAKKFGTPIKQPEVRRVIELQSDLYQKGGLEKSLEMYPSKDSTLRKKYPQLSKLEQYNDPTAHFRIVREEVKQAAIDSKTKLQFPTGETAMKIEGLGETQRWYFKKPETHMGMTSIVNTELSSGRLKIGMEIQQGLDGDFWIVTDILGDGKFKAVPKSALKEFGAGGVEIKRSIKQAIETGLDESFDISGKVDTNNPIYKFYEKEVSSFLKNKFGASRIIDPQGVSWFEIPVTKQMAKEPVLAYGKASIGTILTGLGIGTAVALGEPFVVAKLRERDRKRLKESVIWIINKGDVNSEDYGLMLNVVDKWSDKKERKELLDLMEERQAKSE